MHKSRRAFLSTTLAATLGAATFSTPAYAQAWPTKPVRLIVPFPPGGGADELARILGRQLTDRFNQTFVVENRTGAGGIIGWHSVLRAEPDGYTFLVAGISLAVTGPINQGREYEPSQDLTHVALLGGPPTVLIVHPSHPAKNLKEFVDMAKKSPEGISWGSPGLGTHGSLIGDALRRATGTDMVHVPYRGGAPAFADVAANHIPAAFVALSGLTEQIHAGRVRALAVTSGQRVTEFPDVPTFKELGYPKLTGAAWFSLSAPPALPASIANQLNKEVRDILKTPEAKAALQRQSMEVFDWDVPTFNKFVQEEAAYWSPYTKEMLEKVK